MQGTVVVALRAHYSMSRMISIPLRKTAEAACTRARAHSKPLESPLAGLRAESMHSDGEGDDELGTDTGGVSLRADGGQRSLGRRRLRWQTLR